MKFFILIYAGLVRNRTRLLLTILSIAIAFLLFGLLRPVSSLFESGAEVSGSQRLISAPKHSISDMLLLSQVQQVQQVSGVETVAHQTWFGGTFRDAQNAFPQWAVPAESFLAIHPEMQLPDEQLAAFLNTRTGVVVGRQLAEEFNLAIGERISLNPNIWHNRDGKPWEFELVGIYEGEDESVDTRVMLMNYEYFDEYRAFANGTISNIAIEVETGADLAQVAKQVDDLFENSTNETITATEKDYLLSFTKLLGNVGLIVNGILYAVFFTMLLLTANTMSQAIRGRIAEFAILRTLGFQQAAVLWLVLGESILIVMVGALIGLGLAAVLLPAMMQAIPGISQLGHIGVGLPIFLTGVAISIMTGLLVGLPPAVQARRLNIVDTLRSQ